jgi:hypothetical protein
MLYGAEWVITKQCNKNAGEVIQKHEKKEKVNVKRIFCFV